MSNKLLYPPPEFNRNERPSAGKLNMLSAGIRQLEPSTLAPRQLFPAIGGGGGIAHFQIVTANGDYLICNPYDAVTQMAIGDAENIVKVAKSYLCRRFPFDGEIRDGITYTYTSNILRTADDGTDTISEVVIPIYVVGDVIVAKRTNVLVNEDAVETIVLDWLDDNDDGRAWAKVAV